MPKPRLTTTQRGYGILHERRRAALLAKAYNAACPLCGELMVRGQALDLDHSNPADKRARLPGDRMVHRFCNRSRKDGASKTRHNVELVSRDW